MATSVLPTLPLQQLPTPNIDEDDDAARVATVFESRLASLTADDFEQEIVWRDVFALTGTLRTFYGPSNVSTTWSRLSAARVVANMKLDLGSARIVRIGALSAWIDACYSFDMTSEPQATGKILVSLVSDTEGGWRIWMLRTILDRLIGCPSVDHLDPVKDQKHTNGVRDGQAHHTEAWDCVIVGGGQFGLSIAGRLQALNLTYVVLETNKNVGDNWKLRYESAKLHTTRDSSYLPFDRTFPSADYNKWLTKDELAKGYGHWAQKYGINIWLESSLKSGEWQADSRTWKLHILQGQHEKHITAKHVVMATGAGGQIPKQPKYPGIENFQGTVMHSNQYRSATSWKHKAAVVIGTANTGHDIAEDMVVAGCSAVTMVQRSPTYVFKTEYYERSQDMTWNDNIPTAFADMQYYSNPMAVLRLMANYGLHTRTRADHETYDALERADFKLIRYGDIIHQIYECFGGHYMDVGAVAKISNGSIKIKSNALPIRYSETGLVFEDGTEISADVVVFATGFEGNTKTLIRDLLGSGIADQIDDFWQLDSEGELRGNCKPTGHPRLWMAGGTCGQARYFSRFVALSIRADVDGHPMKVYRRQDISAISDSI